MSAGCSGWEKTMQPPGARKAAMSSRQTRGRDGVLDHLEAGDQAEFARPVARGWRTGRSW